ncbi:MAG: polysaccharide pyruvyl transferase family protein [Candidatus Brocadiia bacterium]
MRIGILTCHYVINYGAAVQAAALRSVLQSMGHEVTFIDYRPRRNRLIDFVFNSGFSKRRVFDRFLEHAYGTRRYSTYESLHRDPPDYDCYVAGSDQIWGMSGNSATEFPYFLDFATREDALKIAYAPSFGNMMLPIQARSHVRDLLNRFTAISVRETDAAWQVQQLTGKTPPIVLDPSLLHPDLNILAVPVKNKPSAYIACYDLRGTPALKILRERLTTALGIPAIVLGPVETKIFGTLGPGQWLDIIRSASLVITDSFHGVACSISFGRPFFATGVFSKVERVNELLTSLDLTNRVVYDFRGCPLDKEILFGIEYPSVACKLLARRKQSHEWLLSALQGCPEQTVVCSSEKSKQAASRSIALCGEV